MRVEPRSPILIIVLVVGIITLEHKIIEFNRNFVCMAQYVRNTKLLEF